MKPYFCLLVGLPGLDFENEKIEVDRAETLQDAKALIRTRMYDAVVINVTLPDADGYDITKFYPHYRTIIVVDGNANLMNGKNGVYKVIECCSAEKIIENIFNIISNYSNKNDDSLMVLLSIQDSIEELKTSSGFMKSSLNEVHTRLDKLEQNQDTLKNTFGKFSEQRIKAEQFFIDTVTVLRGDLNELSEQTDGSERSREAIRRNLEEAG